MINLISSNLSTIFPIVLSIGSLILSAWSYKTAKEEAYINQYAQRFKMYSKILDLCLYFIHSEVNDSLLYNLKINAIVGLRESKFLFPEKSRVHSKIKEIIQCTELMEYDFKEGNSCSKAILELHQLIDQLETLLIPYLSFEKTKKRLYAK